MIRDGKGREKGGRKGRIVTTENEAGGYLLRASSRMDCSSVLHSRAKPESC